MVCSYLADTEVYLVWYWKKGAGAYGFHTVGNYPAISLLRPPPLPPPQVPSTARSETQQEQDDGSCTGIPPVFPEADVLHVLSWRKVHIAATVGNEAVSRALRGPSSLKPETSAQC